jgi:hypothetical protein
MNIFASLVSHVLGRSLIRAALIIHERNKPPGLIPMIKTSIKCLHTFLVMHIVRITRVPRTRMLSYSRPLKRPRIFEPTHPLARFCRCWSLRPSPGNTMAYVVLFCCCFFVVEGGFFFVGDIFSYFFLCQKFENLVSVDIDL